MPDWRDYILQHFREPVQRLTLVADLDGLLLEETLAAAIRQNSFVLRSLEDTVALRYAYESDYRRHWDQGQTTDALILRSSQADPRALPYDLLQRGRTLTFTLSDLFPRLSYPVVSELDLVHLQPLYQAYQRHLAQPGGTNASQSEMGDRASALFVLKHVFALAPDMIKTPTDLLKALLSRHVRGERVPARLDALLCHSLSEPLFKHWPLETLLRSASAFFAFLQEQWGHYLAALQPADTVLGLYESGTAYETAAPLPFDAPDVRPFVHTLFLEGKLAPVKLPEGWTVQGWAKVGVELDEQAFERRRFSDLLERLVGDLPPADAWHKAWIDLAARWSELTVLRHHLAAQLDAAATDQYKALHLDIEQRFANWMMTRYHTLHSLPFLPAPAMVHHIPHYMAAQRAQHPAARLALLVVDGLALDQWQIIRDVWKREEQPWGIQEEAVFAWVPTLTSISRQAIFAGTAPQFFPDTWDSTGRDAAHWKRFWRERGLRPDSVGYLRNLGVKDLDLRDDTWIDGEGTLEKTVETLIQSSRYQVLGLVINTLDNIMHGMQLGTAGMHQQVGLWLTRYRYLTRLVERLLQASFTVYLTSDHGNIWAQGIGRPKEGVLVDKRGERARLYTEPAFLALARRQVENAVKWTDVGLPGQLQVLLAPALGAFLNKGQHAVCHGGIALEEVIVPFVHISRKQGV
jgi:hypothetical protein